MQHETLKALSIRQPWAELILRGDKTVEFRSQITKIRGRVYIYAASGKPDGDFDENASMVGLAWDELPKGVLVGTVEIVGCDSSNDTMPNRFSGTVVDVNLCCTHRCGNCETCQRRSD